MGSVEKSDESWGSTKRGGFYCLPEEILIPGVLLRNMELVCDIYRLDK